MKKGTCPRCGAHVGFDSESGKPARCGVCVARSWWNDIGGLVPKDDATPERRWAAHRKLWRSGQRFPRSIRSGEQRGQPLLIAAFAPVEHWVAGGGKVPEVSGVQLIHVDAKGLPRKDAGGLDKRSHGTMAGAVTMMGRPIADATRVHVVEGVADALAVATRFDGVVVATGGTSGMKNDRIAAELAGLRLPVHVWPDGEESGRDAAEHLAGAIRGRGGSVAVMPMPKGEDPASMGPRLRETATTGATATSDSTEEVEATTDPLAQDVDDLLDGVRSDGWTKANRDTLRTLWGDIQAREKTETWEAIEALEPGASLKDTLKALRTDLQATIATNPELLRDSLRARTNWDGEVTPRKWLCPEWLSEGRVGMLTGHGGSAKSLLALQLAGVVASGSSARFGKGRNALPDPRGEGKAPRVLGAAGPVVFATWEDEHEEVLRRLFSNPDLERAQLGERLHVLDLAGTGALWGPKDGGHRDTVAKLTKAGTEFESYVRAVKPRLVVIDPVAGAYGGNENDRAAVRAFLSYMNDLAADTGAAFLLIAHPPKGEHDYSGSTDWRAGIRALWTLGPELVRGYQTKNGKSTMAQGQALTLVKANYAKDGRRAWLRFRVEHDRRDRRAPPKVMIWEECRAVEAAEAYHKWRGWGKPEPKKKSSEKEEKRSSRTAKPTRLDDPENVTGFGGS